MELETAMSEAKVPDGVLDWVKDHVRRYLATDGADGHMFSAGSNPPVPTLLLTTTGRKSGEKFIMPLIYGTSGDNYVIIASKGGAPTHPGWFLNLDADPAVEVQVLADRFPAMARVATGAERARLWAEMAALFPPYDDYQKKAGREIPVVVLERA